MGAGALRVLIVDDEFYARMALRKMVGEWCGGAEVVGCVDTGEKAIRILRREQPGLVLTDVRMPGLDGIGLCRYIQEYFPTVLVFIISGYADFEYAQKAITLQVRRYFLKPVDRDELYNALAELAQAPGQEGGGEQPPPAASSWGNPDDLVEQCRHIIQTDYALDLTLHDIARNRLYVHPSYLSRLIKERTGKTFSALLLEERMMRGREHLERSPHLRVGEIATLVGYNQVSQFITHYKRFHGITPGATRKDI